MPDCEEVDRNEVNDDEIDTVSFGIRLHDPSEGVRLSRKDICFIDIEPDNSADELREEHEREMMIDFFVANKELTWGKQFKVALMLGPSLNEDN